MGRKRLRAAQAHLDATMATLAVWFMDQWAKIERGYRRPLTWVALKLKFAFYPLLACAALGWLSWDWTHGRSLDSAEDSVFDSIVQWRPVEPQPSGRTFVVEIDDCSLEWTRAQGIGGWPWPRTVHADLLDTLDRAGVRAVGVDVMFLDPHKDDPDGDAMLDAVAAGGNGRFMFAASRQAADFDAASPLHAAQIAGAYALDAKAHAPGPPVAVYLPFGASMAKHSAITNVSRGQDGVLRDVPLREVVDDWALPTLPARLVSQLTRQRAASLPDHVRVNWRRNSRMPYISAADLLAGKPVCEAPGSKLPDLRGSVVLVGYTAAGISDTKPTPVNAAMPGVEVWAEATDALLHGGVVWMPPSSFKYLLASLLLILTTYAFWRGEPHEDVDGVFVAVNGLLLTGAVIGLTFFGVFVDIFASIGFVSLCFGICRMYAAIQRGRAIGNNDFRDEYDPDRYPWLAMVRLRYVKADGLTPFEAVRGKREYRRLLRRQLYAGGDAVMIEGIVERKSWLHEILDDLMLLIWSGADRSSVLEQVKSDLDRLHQSLNQGEHPLDEHGQVMLCISVAEIDDHHDDTTRGERMRLRDLLGQDLNATDEFALCADNREALDPAHTLVIDDTSEPDLP